jgi:hypothetical protein
VDKKKKKNKKGSKPPITVGHVEKKPVTITRDGSVDDVNITQTTCKTKYCCKLCKGSHLLKDCPGIFKVIEAWSTHPRQPLSSTSEQHVDDRPLTSQDTVGKKKVESSFHVCYVEGIIKLTFSLIWTKPQNYWKT